MEWMHTKQAKNRVVTPVIINHVSRACPDNITYIYYVIGSTCTCMRNEGMYNIMCKVCSV